jgi:hypothetical protein
MGEEGGNLVIDWPQRQERSYRFTSRHRATSGLHGAITLQRIKSATTRKRAATTKLIAIEFQSNTPLRAVRIASKSQAVVAAKQIDFVIAHM